VGVPGVDVLALSPVMGAEQSCPGTPYID